MSSDEEEVAEDYRTALEELSFNQRSEISNLTTIARDYTAYAMTISEVLQQHILKTGPNKKLPALYVLDSIAKNVGTPYTLYFGRNLFKVFMESYAVVNNDVRRKMVELLKTWKQPVAGSMDTRPVFSHELVRPIENALIKANAAAMQQGAVPGRARSAVPGVQRDTPTPPGMRGYGLPPGVNVQQPYPAQHGPLPGHPAYSNQQQPPSQQQYYHPPPNSQGHGQPQYNSPGPGAYGSAVTSPPGISIETLSKDIQKLIAGMTAEFSQNPHDTSVQSRLKALLDLQGVVQRSNLPPDQLELIKNKVTELSAVTMRATPSQTSTPTPTGPMPLQQPLQQAEAQAPPAAPVSASPAPTAGPGASSQAQVTLDSLLGKGAMAALLARSATPQGSTPTPNPPYAGAAAAAVRSPQPAPAQPQGPPSASAPAAPGANPMALLDQLRQAGMIPSTTPTNTGPTAPPPPPPSQPIVPPNIASLLAASPAGRGWSGLSVPAKMGIDVAALKQQFRPEAVASLYEDLGPPCTQCGRRFKTDEEGRKKKTAHMDWHFRVLSRSTDAERRGLHRSWYVDELDWLKSRETVDSDHVAAPDEAAAEAARAAEASKPKYIPVPDPSKNINNVCPICQDKFVNKWLDTAQEWVWLDAVLVGGRAYHASCHAEATRDREGTPGAAAATGSSRRTPDPVLGKRKAEVGISSPKVRSLKTSA